jgi:hypothetical protein
MDSKKKELPVNPHLVQLLKPVALGLVHPEKNSTEGDVEVLTKGGVGFSGDSPLFAHSYNSCG